MEGLSLPIPVGALEGASDTLAGAVEIARGLPAEEGANLLVAAHEAFTYAFEVTAAVSAGCAVLAAIIAGALLRNVRAPASGH
jgi:DHA2 family multidrug resistance protein-like MFS transporter